MLGLALDCFVAALLAMTMGVTLTQKKTGRGRSGRFVLFTQLIQVVYCLKLLDAAASVDELLLTGEEGMTC
jgi:hypothetical protein